MVLSEEVKEQLRSELNYTASRSSGPGGQNVNKVNTRVELRFAVLDSQILSFGQKKIMLQKLGSRINQNNELIMVSEAERSQLRNKERVTQLFFELLEKALTPEKKRIKTKPTLASINKRLERKKNRSLKKQLRKPPGANPGN